MSNYELGGLIALCITVALTGFAIYAMSQKDFGKPPKKKKKQ